MISWGLLGMIVAFVHDRHSFYLAKGFALDILLAGARQDVEAKSRKSESQAHS